ncbi:MAG: hypothetical protein AAGI46_06030 [Planctomycetota bacterium]
MPAVRHLLPASTAAAIAVMEPAAVQDSPQAAFEVRPGVIAELIGDDVGCAVTLAWCDRQRLVFWIGRHAWASPSVLQQAGLLERSLLVDARRARDRLWAAEQGTRWDVVGTVVVDGRGFGLTETRRLQLAARGRGVRVVLLRPSGERRSPSAAGERWDVQPVPVFDHTDNEPGPRRPAWDVRLLRRKGRRLLPQPHRLHASGLRIGLPAGLSLPDVPDTDVDLAPLLVWRVRWDSSLGRCQPEVRAAEGDSVEPAVPVWPRLAVGLPAQLAGGQTLKAIA